MDLSRCKKTIKKIGTNHVIVEHSLKDKDGKDYVVQTDEYGQDRIDEEKLILQQDYEKWDGMSATKIDVEKTRITKELAEVGKIETEMKKTISIKEIK